MWAVGMAGGKRCKEMVMRWGDSCRAFPLLPERLEGMGTEGAAWKRCLRARILLRTLSLPEVFQHPVEYMAKRQVNIATMQLYRDMRGGLAVMVIESDQPIWAAAVEELRACPGIERVTYLNMEGED